MATSLDQFLCQCIGTEEDIICIIDEFAMGHEVYVVIEQVKTDIQVPCFCKIKMNYLLLITEEHVA